MKISYEWLQTFFEEGALPCVEELEQKLMFHAYEIEGVESVHGDSIIDVDVLPNRAADSLSHRGIAREVSTLFEIPMKHDQLREDMELSPTTNTVEVTLSGKDACAYYVAAHIRGVEVKESPDWLKKRLEAIGQKSINNVVDATNYVLFELGRPTHIFDAKKFVGDIPRVGTRLARDGEKITLLGGGEVELKSTMTLVVDTDSDTPLAVGGVKGGVVAEVDENTTELIVEVANFNPTQTRLTSQALKLRTDASARFENNMADKLADYGAVAVVKLIREVAGGELVGYACAGKLGSENKEVVVSESYILKLLGAPIDTSEIKSIFERLQFEYSYNGNEFVVKAPFERRDIHIPEDVIEEIGRVYGYSKIESKQLAVPEKKIEINKKFAYSEIIREALTNIGFSEMYLYSLRDDGDVKLRNALASDKDHLRSNLSDGITEALNKNKRNMPLLGLYDSIKIFEIGNVFLKGREETHVCIGVRVSGKKKKEERTAEVLDNTLKTLKCTIGKMSGELSLKRNQIMGYEEFNLDEILKDLPDVETYKEMEIIASDISYKTVSQYPFVLRDIALWVPKNTSAEDIKELIKKHSKELLKRIDLFDEFEKDGRISYAFHLVFQSMNETLTDSLVGDIMDKIEGDIANYEGWEVR